MGDHVLYVPFHDSRKWAREGLRTRDGHIFRQLVRQRGTGSVTVLDRPTAVAELIKLRGRWTPPGRTLRAVGRARITLGREGAEVFDILVPRLGLRRGSFHRWLMREYGARRYFAAARSVDVDPGGEAVLWLCHPFAAGMVLQWPAKRICVDAFDNFAVHPELRYGVRRELFEKYRLLCERADRIVVNSAAMQEFLRAHFGRESMFVPNGVDRELFRDAEPMALPDLPRPLIGYAGKLGLRIDIDLLTRLAAAIPQGTIVIAGQVLNARWMRPTMRNPRIRFLGDLHYDELPSFLTACDVCIVPHRVGAGENHGDATKLYEYLAAGRKVVTTPIEGVSRFSGRVTIARTSSEFIAATLAAAAGEATLFGPVLESETWAARAELMWTYFGLSGAGAPTLTTG